LSAATDGTDDERSGGTEGSIGKASYDEKDGKKVITQIEVKN
jgi:hypothetical protein